VLSHATCVLFLTLILFQSARLIARPLSLTVLDVGQGDAILIQTPEYKTVLIDSGPDSSVLEELGARLPFFTKTIDLFLLTHPHLDHYGGILDIMSKYNVKTVALTGVSHSDPVYLEFLKAVRRKGIPIIYPQNNHDLQIGSNTFLDVLYPFEGQSLIGQQVDNKNNSSVITRLIQNSKPLAFLPGDAEQELEHEILLNGQDAPAQILKAGHHGSKTASTPDLINAVRPEKAVISVGTGNKFGHPHKEALERLKNIPTQRTDLDGTINFKFFGEGL
jgi:competence protein ComEC